MRRLIDCALVVVAVSTFGVTAGVAQEKHSAQPEQKPEATAAVQPLNRFEGKTAFRTKQAKSKELHVVIRNWEIHGRQRIEKFPEQGFMVVHLHSGSVTTVINGKEEKHGGNAFWSVPAGSSMSVQVTSESALLEVMSIRE
jgi:hypothetical protein